MSKIGGDMGGGLKKFLSHPPSKFMKQIIVIFLRVSQKWHCLKILEVTRK